MKPLFADDLNQDPKIIEAKRLIREAVESRRKNLTGVLPSDPERLQSYKEAMKEFSEMRGTNLVYPFLGSGLGNGALVELADGSVKYDFITGIGVHYLGHNSLTILNASLDAALENTLMQGNLQPNRCALKFNKLMLEQANCQGADFKHCFITSSGAMANENALKVLFQKNFPANRLLVFENCFMGRTMVLSQATDKPGYREGLPATIAVDYVPFFDPDHPEESTHKAVTVLQQHLKRYPKQYAAMSFELIQGEGGGYQVGEEKFFKTLMKILKENGIGILIDEVQTFGRTSELFAFNHFHLQEFADVVTVGKLSQACATLLTAPYKPKPGLISQTFTATTAAIYAGIAIIESIVQGGLLGPQGKIMELHRYFVGKMEALAARYPQKLAGPYGLGGMIACTPLQGEPEAVNAFMVALYEKGVIGFTAGSKPLRARFLMPMGIVTHADIDAVAEIFEKALLSVTEKK